MRPFTQFVKNRFQGNPIRGAEVGVQRGDNALTLVANLTLGHLSLVDIWGEYDIATKYEEGTFRRANFQEFLPTVKERFGDNPDVTIMRMASTDASRLFEDGSLDFVYLDACHSFTAVQEDINSWFPKVTKGGILGGHDYSKEIYPDLVRAVNDFIVHDHFLLYQESLDWWIVK